MPPWRTALAALAYARTGVAVTTPCVAAALAEPGAPADLDLLRKIPKIRDGLLNSGAVTAELHPDLVVDSRDVTVEKPRFGAFYGTDLEIILRSRGVDTLIVSGISSPVCCDTTAREAHARHFRVLFLSDGTAWTGPEDEAARFHRSNLEVLDDLFAQLTTIDDILSQIRLTVTTSPSSIGS